MSTRTYRFAVVLAAALSLVLSACGAKPAEPPKAPATQPPAATAKKPAVGGELIYVMPQEPKIFNPMIAGDAYSGYVTGVVFDGLVKANQQMEVDPWLAKSWRISDDGLTYTFDLRNDVKFHDGKPLTADDVVFTYMLAKHKDYKGPRSSTFASLTKVEAVNPTQVRFTLAKKQASFLTNLTFGIMPKHVFDGVEVANMDKAPASMKPVGSGPYKFTEYKSGQYVLVEANRDWFQKAQGWPYIDKIRFRIIPDSNTQIAALEAGEVHVLTNPDSQHVDRLKKEKGDALGAFDWPRNGYGYMTFNVEKFPTSEKEVRQALSMALDREGIIKGVLDNKATVPAGPIPPISWAFDNTVKGYSYDPKGAAALLEKAGWKKNAKGVYEKDGKPLQIGYFGAKGSSIVEGIALQAQKNWKDLGADVKVELMDFQVMLDQYLAPGKFEVTFSGFSLGLDPDPYSLFHSDAAKPDAKGNVLGFNRGRYRNATVDKLLDDARQESDRTKRKALYSQFQKTVIDDAPQLWVYVNTWTDFVSKKVKGVVNYPGYGVGDVHKWYMNEQ